MKNQMFITKKAVAYWKQEAKKGGLRVATDEKSVYIINGYNAFRLPLFYYDELIKPAINESKPDPDIGYVFTNGTMKTIPASDIIKVWKENTKGITEPASKTIFTMDFDIKKDLKVRLFKLASGDISAVNQDFIDFIQWQDVAEINQNGALSPMLINFNWEDVQALLLPVRLPEAKNKIKELLKV